MHKFKSTNKQLKYLTKEEYVLLLKSGMFWEIYPEATGIYDEDTNKKPPLPHDFYNPYGR